MLTTSPASAPSSSSAPDVATYSVGSLIYNRRTVTILFGWLLWGDFAFNIFESIFGRFMPLYLNDLKASNTLIGITTGSIAGVVNILFLPNISQWSDRLRTRWGRRIPLLTIVTPLTTFSLLGVGFAPEINDWIQVHAPHELSSLLSGSALLLSLLCAFTISYHFFNMVLVNAYGWLLRDVVPLTLMARFLSWFRIIGNIAGATFLWFVFPTILSHRKETFLGIAVFYFVAFMLMCWNVKEGEYVEPEPHSKGSNIITRFGAYFRDCLALPIYRNFFIAIVLVTVASGCAGSFITLFARNTLHLSMGDMGHWGTYCIIAGSLVLIPAGWICDKFSSMKVSLYALVVLAIMPMTAYLFVNHKSHWLVYTLLSTVPGTFWALSITALSMTLFPGRVFGQFSAGMNVFGCGGLIFGNYLAGLFMDLTGSNFRLIFLWSVLFYASALIPFLFVYRDWKKFGGPANYVAPIPDHMLED